MKPPDEIQAISNQTRPKPDDLIAVTSVLEAILKDRTILGEIDREHRKALLMAAGRISRPDRLEIMKATKRFRRIERTRQKAADKAVRAATFIRSTREKPVYTVPEPKSEIAHSFSNLELEKASYCYICKFPYTQVHFFYDSMCPPCAQFNYSKRFQTAPLIGMVALITGARVKIGFQAALMMLRAGAQVVVTTRFPHDAAIRFSETSDFESWKARLQIHGLDLRHSPSVELFTQFIKKSYSRLDILINNAAQTVRRPQGFYTHLMAIEKTLTSALPAGSQMLLQEHQQLSRAVGPRDALSVSDSEWLNAWHQQSIGLTMSAALSQIPYDYDERSYRSLDVFPVGKTDADLQQVDLRAMNSWRMKLGDVPTPEMLEVTLVNSVAPFILCSKLKSLMLASASPAKKHIVNVSAMEGKFARFTKTDKHPHTNMAKAALNMMTYTSAPDYAKDDIFMNAVDTGWVTDEDPVHHALRKQIEHDFQPPLDIVDGAARICDPFFSGILTGEHHWGKFFKDYKPTSW